MPAKQKIYKQDRADTINHREDIQNIRRSSWVHLFLKFLLHVLWSARNNLHVLSNNALYNDMCIIDSYKIKLHVLAFIPCRADDIHGQCMWIVWPCTWFIRVGIIAEYYIDFPQLIVIGIYIFYCEFAFGLTCNVICNDRFV